MSRPAGIVVTLRLRMDALDRVVFNDMMRAEDGEAAVRSYVTLKLLSQLKSMRDMPLFGKASIDDVWIDRGITKLGK